MRYHLLEYINYDRNKFIERWSSEGKPYLDVIGEDGNGFIGWLEGHDPSPAKKYVNWLIVRYMKGDIKRLEDIPSRISGALRIYMGLGNKKKLKPEHRDINRIRDIEDVVDEYGDIDVTSKSEMADKYVSSGDAKIVHDDSEYKIVIPKTEEASCYYGRNTRWCTASRENNMFSDYSSDGYLYIILHKPSNTRWQFHFESEQFMDERDDPIEIMDFFKKHKKIFGVFKKLGIVDYKPNQWKIGNNYYNDEGQRHREDGPAVERANGDKVWYLNGKHHREDGPAVEFANGDKVWWLNGKYHREDGPAIERANGDKYWYLNGNHHREDGPAIEKANGDKYWYLNGKLQREERADGDKYWYLNNQRHRIDGPAVELANGNKYWYLNGQLHRIDGPAVELANGDKYWYLNDKEYSFSDWKQEVEKIKNKMESIMRLRKLSGI